MKKKKIVIFSSTVLVLVAGILILLAFSHTWGKTDIQFRIHINEELVRQSTFGESPTFAIWLKNRADGEERTIYVTRRAATGDWEGKADVPVALPQWFELFKRQYHSDEAPTLGNQASMTITGATPQPGYFTTGVRVPEGSSWSCFIEVNLAGDFNDEYPMYNEKRKTSDEYLSGQPALLYEADIRAEPGNEVRPEIKGMTILDSEGHAVTEPLKGITTAKDVLDEIVVLALKPKPRIVEHWPD